MGIIFFIRRIISIYTMINKPISGFVAETEAYDGSTYNTKTKLDLTKLFY